MSRQQILEAALALLVHDNGASLAAIAAAAGVGRATLHRHFASREELLYTLAEGAIGAAEEALTAANLAEGPADEALARAIDLLIPIGNRVHFLLNDQQLWEAPALTPRLDAIEATLAALIDRGQASGQLRRDLPRRWLQAHLFSTLFCAWEAIYQGNLAPRDAATIVCRSLFEGIKDVNHR